MQVPKNICLSIELRLLKGLGSEAISPSEGKFPKRPFAEIANKTIIKAKKANKYLNIFIALTSTYSSDTNPFIGRTV